MDRWPKRNVSPRRSRQSALPTRRPRRHGKKINAGIAAAVHENAARYFQGRAWNGPDSPALLTTNAGNNTGDDPVCVCVFSSLSAVTFSLHIYVTSNTASINALQLEASAGITLSFTRVRFALLACICCRRGTQNEASKEGSAGCRARLFARRRLPL